MESVSQSYNENEPIVEDPDGPCPYEQNVHNICRKTGKRLWSTCRPKEKK